MIFDKTFKSDLRHSFTNSDIYLSVEHDFVFLFLYDVVSLPKKEDNFVDKASSNIKIVSNESLNHLKRFKIGLSKDTCQIITLSNAL